MNTLSKEFALITRKEIELTNITPLVKDFVAAVGVKDGMVFIMSHHTTTGITVNEGLPDIEQDIVDMLKRLAPEDGEYRHARFLPSDGQMAVNAVSHLRSAILGFEVFLPLENGSMKTGGRQTIYFVELDGPQERTFSVKILY